MYDEVLEGGKRDRFMSAEFRKEIHGFILDNYEHLDVYRRRYEGAVTERNADRENFRRQQRRRGRRHMFAYPLELQKLPDFSKWILQEVRREQESGVTLSPMVVDTARGPLEVVAAYKSIYAFGNHFCVLSSERCLKTMDSGVAATFRQTCRNGIHDVNQVEADVEYIGHVEEILELNYRRHCVVVFVCDFVKANYRGENATIKKDKWGFTLANYNRRPGIVCRDSFVFPKHCEQVFYCDAREAPGWKIVLRKEVRGRRVLGHNEDEMEPNLFKMGEDEDFEGLRPQREVGEEPVAPVNTGQNVFLEEVLVARTHRTVRQMAGRGSGGGCRRACGRGRAATGHGGRIRQAARGRPRGGRPYQAGINKGKCNSVVDEDMNDEQVLYAEYVGSGDSSQIRLREEEEIRQRRRTRRRLGAEEDGEQEENDGEGHESSAGTGGISLSTSNDEDDISA